MINQGDNIAFNEAEQHADIRPVFLFFFSLQKKKLLESY